MIENDAVMVPYIPGRAYCPPRGDWPGWRAVVDSPPDGYQGDHRAAGTDWSGHGILAVFAVGALGLIADGGTLLFIAWLTS